MKRRVTRLLSGTVRIAVESGFPERVLNLCSAHQLSFWDMEWRGPTSFAVTLARQDYRILRKLAKKLDCEITVEKREGVPFFVGRFKKRYALLAGLAAAILLTCFASFFVWDFEVQGNHRITDQEILRALEEEGVTYGTFGLGIHPETLKNHMLLKIPELSWLTVNVKGFKATVIVRERREAPPLRQEQRNADVIAEKDGLLTDVRLFGGHAQVKAGDTVTKGQLLISGVADLEERGVYFTRGEGEVWARTWYQLTAKIPKTVQKKVYTGREKHEVALLFGKQCIKIWPNSSIYGGSCDKITRKQTLRLPGDLATPFSLRHTIATEYTLSEQELTAEEAQQRAMPTLRRRLWEQMGGAGIVKQVSCHAEERDGVYAVTLSAECEEEIGKTREWEEQTT